MELGEFLAAALQRAGGLAEAEHEDRLEVLLPPAVAASLDLAEEASLRLRGEVRPGEAYAGYGSDLLARIGAVAAGTGRRFRLELDLPLPKRERVRREGEEVLRLRNATARLASIETTTLGYLVFDFRYAALSEDRAEGLLSVAVNRDGGWSPGLAPALAAFLSAHPGARRPWSAGANGTDSGRLYPAACSLVLRLALEEIRPFIARMERRLTRDLRRIGDYYAALRDEVQRRGARGRGSPEVVRGKLEAIEAERCRRGQDARRRYAVQIQLEPLGALAVRVTGLLLHARLRRRKAEADARLGWNPLARRLDRWLCSGCGGDAGVPFLCDRLHVLCAACPPQCPGCGRGACAACGEGSCRCGGRPGTGEES